MFGLGLLGLVVLATFVVALRTLYERRDPLCRGIAFGATMGIISNMIHSWVDFNLQIPANALTFVVPLALAWVGYRLPSGRQISSVPSEASIHNRDPEASRRRPSADS